MSVPDQKIEIITGAHVGGIVKVEIASELVSHLANKVSISLRYYQKKPECWSEWNDRELKSFTKVVVQLRDQTSDEIKGRGTRGSPACRMHVGEVKTAGFVRPPEISPDISFHELKVTDKARLHGFFLGEVFFLVWLDRNHRAFPA